MKKEIKIYSIALPMVLSLLIGLSSGITSLSNSGGTDDSQETEEEPVAETTLVYNNLYTEVGNAGYSVMQGGCTDGTYAYFLMEDQSVEGSIDELVKMKISDWSIVKVVTDLDLNHGNDMTFNTKTNKIIVVHHKPNYNTISVVNRDTLKIESNMTLEQQVYSIGYDAANDRYAVGVCGTQSFSVLDSNFHTLNTYPCIGTGYTSQGMDCDDKYVYFIQSEPGCTDNIIIVYDWDGNHIKTIKVDVPLEGESLIHVGSTFYANFNSSAYKGTVYELKLPLG